MFRMLAIAAPLLFAAPVLAQTADEVRQTSPEFDAAMDAGDARKALPLIEPQLRACIAEHGGDGAPSAALRPCVMLMATGGFVMAEAGRPLEAVAMARRAVAVAEAFPAGEYTVLANLMFGGALERLGRHGEAEAPFALALEGAEQLLAGDPALATYIARRAGNLVQLGRHAEALPLAERAVAIAGDTVEGNVFRMMQGTALTRLGRLVEAEATLRTGAARLAVLMGPSASQTIRMREMLAHCLAEQNRVEESVAIWRETIALRRAEGDSPDLADSLSGLSVVLVRAGQYREAEAAAREVLAVRLRFFGETSNFTGLAYNNLGLVLLESGRLEEAAMMFGRSVEVIKASGVANVDEMTAILANLSNVLVRYGETGRAIDVLRQVLAIADRAFGSGHIRTVLARNNLAAALGRHGQRKEAIPLLEANYAAARALGAQGGQLGVQSAASLANFLAQEGDRAQARGWFDRAQADARSAFRADHAQRIMLGWSHGQFLLDDPSMLPQARTLLREAGRQVLVRAAAGRDFDAQAQAEMKAFASVFRDQVRAAWALGTGRSG